MNEIKTLWRTSKSYRVWLVIATLYFLLRLAAQVYFTIEPFQSSALSEGQQISSDLQIYVTAAQHFSQHQDLYLKGSLAILETHYPYSPVFAFLYGPILLLPLPILVGLSLFFHVVVYVVLYLWWARIFAFCRLERVAQLWARMLPLYLVFAAFWDDLAYLNIYVTMALCATFLIDAILREKLGWAAFWLGVVILPIKPHWAFALVIPLLAGQRRFFWKLMMGTMLAYFAVLGITLLAGGISYGLGQYADYLGFLARLSRDFPWRGPDSPFLGYNHSVVQTVLYFLGISAGNKLLATLLKVLLLLPLGLLSLKLLLKPATDNASQKIIELAFVFYAGTFLWLDMVWEVSLGMPVFVYLLAVSERRWQKILLWAVFLPYALIDFWRLVSYLAFGDAILYQGSYVLSDPLIYLPVILLVLLVFYGLLLARLWPAQKAAENAL